MANQKRKPANAQPLSANPLFPAVVALWFGALFGLGSLAVRPSLLEELVLKSHIDLIIPAAAPPLGITARILLALVLAALGAVLGIMLSRRLTRPRPELHERKRGALDLTAADSSSVRPRVRARDAHPDAPARRPISAHEELGEQAAPSGPGMLGSSMLALRRRALALVEEEREFVPLKLAPLPGIAADLPLDLATLAQSENALPPLATAPLETPPAPATTPLDWSRPAPVTSIEPLPAEAALHDGRQVFGMAPPEPQAQAPRQIFGVVAEGDHVSQDFVKAAGFQTSVFDAPEASPLFGRAEAVGVPEPVAPPPSLAAEPLPSPASLGMTDLAARLAESMRRRRERTATPPADGAAALTDQPTDLAPASDYPAAVLPAMPSAFVPAAAAEPAPTPVLAQFSASPPVPAEPVVPAPLAMPAAMRPLALDAFLADDEALDPGLLPPRHIAMPAAIPTALTAPAVFAVPISPVMAEPAANQHDDEPDGDDTPAPDSIDNPYASLLGLTPPRPAFVRIDEPATGAYEAPEPVVIFPGQAPQSVPIFAAETATADDNAFRRFDAPASAGQGQPVAANSAAATVDPAEAEQALRAALNNLQRMSGAA